MIFLCSLAAIWFNGKEEHHIEENSRKEDRRGACGSATEVYLSDFKKRTEREATFFFGLNAFHVPENPQLYSESSLGGTRKLRETEIKTQQRALKRGMKALRVKEAAGNSSEAMCV